MPVGTGRCARIAQQLSGNKTFPLIGFDTSGCDEEDLGLKLVLKTWKDRRQTQLLSGFEHWSKMEDTSLSLIVMSWKQLGCHRSGLISNPEGCPGCVPSVLSAWLSSSTTTFFIVSKEVNSGVRPRPLFLSFSCASAVFPSFYPFDPAAGKLLKQEVSWQIVEGERIVVAAGTGKASQVFAVEEELRMCRATSLGFIYPRKFWQPHLILGLYCLLFTPLHYFSRSSLIPVWF